MSLPGYPINVSSSSQVSNSYYDASSGNTFHGSESQRTSQRFEDKVGSVTPGWPNAIRTNPYLRSKFVWNDSAMSVSAICVSGPDQGDSSSGQFSTSHVSGGYSPWADSTNWSTAVEINQVRERLIAKLIDKIQSRRVNLGEIYATRNQTANMVASTARRLATAYTAVRKGNFRGAADQLFGRRVRRYARVDSRVRDGVHRDWLALQYGWKPLLGDIYNSCETVRQAWNKNDQVIKVNASASATQSKKIVKWGASWPWPGREIVSTSGETRGNASISFRGSGSTLNSLSQLGITNPLSLAWELLPYSFVVDWFYPIGPFLERLDYSNGLVFQHGWLTYHSKTSATARLNPTSVSNGAWQHNWSGGGGGGDAFVMVREALSSFPSVPPPRLKDPFSLTHVANGLSLLATAFGRK